MIEAIAKITGTDGETIILKLEEQTNYDQGIRYAIKAHTADGTDLGDTETSGDWFGGETWNEETLSLEITPAIRAQARASAIKVASSVWRDGWDYLELDELAAMAFA
jgi:hypothetical protein